MSNNQRPMMEMANSQRTMKQMSNNQRTMEEMPNSQRTMKQMPNSQRSMEMTTSRGRMKCMGPKQMRFFLIILSEFHPNSQGQTEQSGASRESTPGGANDAGHK